MARIGVLALQGDFREHIRILRRLGADANEVRLPQHLAGLDGLILPGGESTTMGKLAIEYQLLEPLRDLAGNGLPMWGTCAGLILLARDIGRKQPLIGVLDVRVQRNAFGRQVNSFEADLAIPVLAEPERPFRAVFIRAPLVTDVGPGVEVVASLAGDRASSAPVVAVQQDHLLGTAFHPELADDDRFHQYFLTLTER
ncbi:MAG: pyridoxal 5'-phosphate synthase glutaminase subunit PdxT [Anaerolineae bacterium]